MIMKKVFNSLFVIIAAMIAFAACVKEENAPADLTKTVQFFAESIETKTAFGTPDGSTYPTLWTENDESVHLSMNLTSSSEVAITPSDDFKTAAFTADVTDDESGSYVFCSVSPAAAVVSFSKDYKSYNLEIPTVQTPTATSVDENAQILVAKSESYTEFPTTVNMQYKHFTAYGKMTLKNLALDGAVISSVSLTFDKNIAYRYYYYPEDGSCEENGSSSTITINTSSTSDIWFACAPVDVSKSSAVLVVNTDKGTFSKTLDFGENKKFESGKIARFDVDMSDIELEEPVVYELVTDVAELTPGSEVIIVGDKYALSTNQKTSNIAATSVELSDDSTLAYNLAADVQIFTIEEGTKDGTVSFKKGDAYIFAASSSSNHLKTQDSKDDNASWSVSISDGVATIVAQGENTRNVMRYNPNNGSPLFSCYGSTSSTGSLVSIYKLPGTGSVLENYLNVSASEILVDADATSATFTVSSDLEWNAAASSGATATKDGNTVNVSFPANESSGPKTYTVTVSASGVDSKTVTITQLGVVKRSTISEVIEMSTGSSLETEGLVMAKYSRGVMIGDDTGEILVYNASGVSAEIGDKVSVSGTKGAYGGIGQINSPVVTVNSSNNTITYPKVTVVDGATLDTYTSKKEVSYIQYTGTLSVSGSYYNVNVDGATTAVGSLQYPLSSFGLSEMDGKKIKVTGYFVGVSSSKYINTMVTAVEVVEAGGETPEPEPDPDPTPDPSGDSKVLEWTLGNKAYSEKATINETANVPVLKLGTSSLVGNATITLPAGTRKVTFSAVGWNGKSSALEINDGSTTIFSTTVQSNNGAANNSPYTITSGSSDNYTFDYSVDSETQLTISTVSGKTRVIIWDIVAHLAN